MKKLINCLAILCLIASFTACKKDKDLDADLKAAEENELITATKRSCGLHDHMEGLLANPDYKKQHEARLARMENSSFTRDANCDNPTILPVAVHFQGISNPDIACLRLLAQNQMTIINDDYQGNNSDITNWDNSASSSFPGISNGDACLEFCLASQNHPSGYNLSDGDLAVTVNQTTGDNASAWSGYINIFVRANTGLLGYSPLGGSGNGDGVVVDATAFGSGSGCTGVVPGAPYNLGRTLTHELGHYLLLDHVWGGNGGCNDDDQVNDTPVSTQPYYGCPNVGASSCSSTDMHMSYMDYTNDACMYMFSAGQVARVENYVATNLQNVSNNASAVCGGGGGGNTPTCNDGVQNGNETGVDCGGSCPPCQTAPTCNDGIQNGDETDVDCGGSCAPCQVAPNCNDGIQNGDETGVDCGGSCAPCQTAPTCFDGVQNGNETGIDCGGSCPPCQISESCDTPTNVDAIVLSSTSAEVNWNAQQGAVAYKVKYRIQGTSNWSTRTANSNFRVLNNLGIATTYQYKVRTLCADGTKSPFSSIQTFTTFGEDNGGCDGLGVEFYLVLDDYGSETTWKLKNLEENVVVDQGGPYSDGTNGTEILADWCLKDGCYRFRIKDSYGDGICCDYGEGFYAMYDEDGYVIAESDGQFGTSESFVFCIENGLMSGGVDQNRSQKLENGNRGQAKKIKKANK